MAIVSFEIMKGICKHGEVGQEDGSGQIFKCKHEDNIPEDCSCGECNIDKCPILRKQGIVNEEKKRDRILNLKEIILDLSAKYAFKDRSFNHYSFNIGIEDVIYIIDKYKDILESSNVFISKANDIGWFNFNDSDFKVFTSDTLFFVRSNYSGNMKNNFNIDIDMKKASEIEISISCDTILTFDFSNPDGGYEKFSFRYDNF